MIPVKKLIEDMQKAYDQNQYDFIVNTLNDQLLEDYGSADLYAERAKVSNAQKKMEECENYLNKAFAINPSSNSATTVKGYWLYSNSKYKEAITCFEEVLKSAPDESKAYVGLGHVFIDQRDFDAALHSYERAVLKDENSFRGYNGIGNVYLETGKLDQAIESFRKALTLSGAWQIYHNLGVAYRRTGDLVESIENLNKALEKANDESDIYSELGNTYQEKEDHEEAIRNFSLALDLNPANDVALYNRALSYLSLKNYKNALKDFEQYIAVTKAAPDFYTEIATSKVEELNKILDNDTYTKASEIVEHIKKLLLFTDNCVTHYTSLTVARALILEESKLRLSEGAFLNDTSEGRELYNYLAIHAAPANSNALIAQVFAPKPFIGSFVAESKHDDLTLWRMYGKEAKEEARGCALTISRDEFLRTLRNAVAGETKTGSQLNTDAEFNFYRVAYLGQGGQFIIPGADEAIEDQLNAYLSDLRTQTDATKAEATADISNIFKLINEIAFLFKSIEYQYEHEVRLVINGSGFEKQILKESVPPRVYIELVPVNSSIKEITLGPKVDRADEWASAFYYSISKKHARPQILISHLPFK